MNLGCGGGLVVGWFALLFFPPCDMCSVYRVLQKFLSWFAILIVCDFFQTLLKHNSNIKKTSTGPGTHHYRTFQRHLLFLSIVLKKYPIRQHNLVLVILILDSVNFWSKMTHNRRLNALWNSFSDTLIWKSPISHSLARNDCNIDWLMICWPSI